MSLASGWPQRDTDPSFWRPGEPAVYPNDRGHTGATVCRRGHVVESQINVAPTGDLGFCAECGARVIARCVSCGFRVRGRLQIPGVVDWSVYEPPPFCDVCGDPHPWADRSARIHQLENLLDEEDVDEATRLLVAEDLKRLQDGAGLTDKDQAAVWRRIKSRAPALLAGPAGRIAETLMTAYIKKEIGL